MHITKKKNLSEVSTFGIGGPADFFAEPTSVEELKEAIEFAREQSLPYFVIGRGSNCLFDDAGFRGVVIRCKISFLEQREGIFRVGAGYNFSLLGSKTAKLGYQGLEFASGIPGSVGGAIYMNAGANGTETADPLSEVEFLDEGGNVVLYQKGELEFSYRHSSFHEWKGVILSGTFSLTPSKEARGKQIEIITYRKNTQPYGEKSAGCIFRNPLGHSSGKLIDGCKLKGMRVGGAEVSTLHGNFIVNTGGATQGDVLALVSLIQKRVREETGEDLQMEVKVVPNR